MARRPWGSFVWDLFVDGDHSYRGVSADLNAFVPRLAAGGHLLLHDSCGENPVQQALLDFLPDHEELEAIRSPYIPAAHWHTSYGSMAHLRKPAESAPLGAAGASPTAVENAGRRRRHTRLPVAIAAAVAALLMIFVLLPEALGDWPYDPRPIGHLTHAHHAPGSIGSYVPGGAGTRSSSHSRLVTNPSSG